MLVREWEVGGEELQGEGWIDWRWREEKFIHIFEIGSNPSQSIFLVYYRRLTKWLNGGSAYFFTQIMKFVMRIRDYENFRREQGIRKCQAWIRKKAYFMKNILKFPSYLSLIPCTFFFSCLIPRTDENILALIFIVFSVVFVYLVFVLYFVLVLGVCAPSSGRSGSG